MAETRARDLANLAGAGATSSTVAFHETARGFTLPAGTGTANQVISSDGDGTTQWKTTLSAPELTSATSDKGVNAYDSDGDDGAVIVVNGSNLGNDPSVLTVEISTDNFVTQVSTSTISILANGTQIQATFNGTETNYNSINAGETVKVKVTKSSLQSAQSATLSGTVTGDPTFSTTSTTASTHTGTLGATSLGSYGGQVTGGGQDSNTKLLLNFDRGGGTDLEDSSNVGGEGHKITATNATIKASPFGDGKSAIRFNAVDGTEVKVASFNTGTGLGAGAFTLETWVWCEEHNSDSANPIIIDTRTGSNGFGLEMVKTSGQLFIWDSVANSKIITESANTLLPLKTWTHVAIVRSGTGTPVKLYLNGKEAGASSNNSSNYSSETLTFGRAYNANGSNFKGYQDEIRVVVGTAVYTSNFTVPTSRLTAIANTKLLIHSNQSDHLFWERNPTIYGGAVQVNDSVAKTDRTDGTASGTTSHTNWNSSAWKFDGTGDWVHTPNVNSTPIGTGDYTIDFWVYPQAQTGSYGQVFDLRDTGGANGFVVEYHDDNDKEYLKYYDSALRITTADNSVPKNTWTHIAVERNNSTLRIYINGTADSSSTTTNDNYSTNDVRIAQFVAHTTQADYAFTGYVDSFRVSGTARYSGTNFSTPTSPPSPDANTRLLINGDGAFFDDSSSDSPANNTAHTITPTGSYHSQAHGGIAPALAWPASLKATGSAGAYFDGTGDYLSITTMEAAGTSDYTYDFWMYPITLTGTLSYIFDTRNSSNVNGLALEYYENGTFKLWDSPASAYIIETTETATKNQWNHIAIERHSGTVRLYINGVASSDTHTSNTSNLSGTTMKIGQYQLHTTQSQYCYSGYLDTFRFVKDGVYEGSNFNTALPTQIYGAYRSQDVGTIQLNATAGTGGGALDYAELSGGTALSTYGLSLSTSGAITGTLTGLADNSNSGGVIRIRARANADDNRVTTLNGGSFTGITQNDNKVPVLFNARRYHGTCNSGSDAGYTSDINGIGFEPDLIWIKQRDGTESHTLFDSVRTEGHRLVADANSASAIAPYGKSKPIADGFHLFDGSNTSYPQHWVNKNDKAYVGWCFKAGGAPVSISNTGNATNITQSASSASGLSITKFTGPSSATSGTTVTIPHNLVGTPEFIMYKNLDNAWSWLVYHKDSATSPASGYPTTPERYSLHLNSNVSRQVNGTTSDASNANNDSGYIDAPTGTNIILSPGNGSTNTNYYKDGGVIYAFKPVAGVSEFGTYTVSLTEEGAKSKTVTLSDSSFTPKLIILKSLQTGSWYMFDTYRGFGSDSSGTGSAGYLKVDDPAVEATPSSDQNYIYDVTAGSFKVRGDVVGLNHSSSSNMLYMAFA